MKYISSGNGRLPLITLIAILTVSLTVNLPGLAVSPLLGKLKDVFPDSSRLQIQLLTVLPNLIIIPFVIFSGKFTTSRNQMGVLGTGLGIFAACGVAYLFADSMTSLILISCILGIGCGLVVPIAAGLIAEHFSGEPRVRVMGMKSGTSNGIVILATIFVGWAAGFGWHDAFFVYLVPLVPLALLPFMTNRFVEKHFQPDGDKTSAGGQSDTEPPVPHRIRLLWGLITLYFLLTYGAMAISYYLAFSMKDFGFSTSQVGVATSMFYLSAMLGGFGLSYAIRALRGTTLYVAVLVTASGLAMLGLLHTYPSYIIGVFLIGLGYGVFQPVMYNKTSRLAPDKKSSTRYLGYLLTANYVGIASVPFIIEVFRNLFHDSGPDFPYLFNAAVLGIMFIAGIFLRKSFCWHIQAPSHKTGQANG